MPKVPTLVDEPKISQDGLDVHLNCQAEADPAPQTVWSKDDKEISANDDYQLGLNSSAGGPFKASCIIKNFSKPLAGVYKCVFKNDQGQSAASFTVTAGDAPEFIEKPHIIQVDKGKALRIKVKVKSKTKPTVSWSKLEQPVQENERVFSTSTEEADGCLVLVLEIKNPEKSDEGKYTCIVANNEGSSSQSLNLVFE